MSKKRKAEDRGLVEMIYDTASLMWDTFNMALALSITAPPMDHNIPDALDIDPFLMDDEHHHHQYDLMGHELYDDFDDGHDHHDDGSAAYDNPYDHHDSNENDYSNPYDHVHDHLGNDF